MIFSVRDNTCYEIDVFIKLEKNALKTILMEWHLILGHTNALLT